MPLRYFAATPRLVANYAHAVSFRVYGAGRHLPFRVPHADVRAERLGGAVDEPVEVSGTDFGFKQILPQRKLDGVVRGADAGDIDLAPVNKPRGAVGLRFRRCDTLRRVHRGGG